MSTDLSVFMEGGRASGSAPEQVGIITRFAGIYLRIGGTGIPEYSIEELRKKYMENPPEGLTSQDIRNMSEDALLDMDYFLNDDEL